MKTGRLRNGAILFNAVSTHDKKRYDGEADLFCVYCPDNHKFYLLNVAGLAKQVSLRVSAPKNNQKKKMLWARNYEI